MTEKKPLRFIFAGTPEFAAESLRALIDYVGHSGDQIVAVYTQPDRPSGRGQKLVASPVKQLAQQHDIPVIQPLNFKEASDRQVLTEWNSDLMIVAAYGLILPKSVLETPRLGCINVHASLLPRWRGAAPIHRAVLAGDRETGITIMQMDVGLDTGDMLLKLSCPIELNQTSGELHDVLAELGGRALIQSLDLLKASKLKPEKQSDTETCYAAKLTKQEGLIDWKLSAKVLKQHVLGLSPWPGAFTPTAFGIMKVHQVELVDLASASTVTPGSVVFTSKDTVHVQTGEGVLALLCIQFPGGKRLSIQEALNGKQAAAFKLNSLLGVA